MRTIEKVILASASPRRMEILTQVGAECLAVPSGEKEITERTEPGEVVEELSRQKARSVYERLKGSLPDTAMVLGADTIVVSKEGRLGKPRDEQDAVRMLALLQGETHSVYTGVTLILGGRDEEELMHTFHAVTRVRFSPMTQEEIINYAARGESLDKAGGYAVQGCFARYVEAMDGEYNNVVGLPVARLFAELKRLSVNLKTFQSA